MADKSTGEQLREIRGALFGDADNPPMTRAEWEVLRREWIGKDLEHLEPAEQIAERIKALHADLHAAHELIGQLIAKELVLVRKKRGKR